MKTLALILPLALLASCAPPVQQTNLRCRYEATAATAGMPGLIEPILAQRQLYEMCNQAAVADVAKHYDPHCILGPTACLALANRREDVRE
jgi:hypothetical protein